jgi:hypothetical protein
MSAPNSYTVDLLNEIAAYLEPKIDADGTQDAAMSSAPDRCVK